MSIAAATLPPPSYYDGLAEELETIATAVRKSPELNQQFADRLEELAKQIRDDTRMMRLKAS